MFLPQLESAVNDASRFQGLVQLVSFSRFKSSVAALENINAVSEGIASPDLVTFLQTTVTKVSKTQLGVTDAKLGAAISEAVGLSCTHVGAIPELIRGIRVHFPHLVHAEHATLTHSSAAIAQLGLGHAYSRAKVKFNVHRVDNMIIQAIALLDQLDKDVNTFSMRIREWYSYHFPELIKLVPENVRFARVAKAIGDRKALNEDKLEIIEAAGVDSEVAEAILSAARSSMGMDISPVDLINICLFADRVVSLAQYRIEVAEYLHGKMTDVAPNLAALIGDQVGARLISHAGSLTNLAKCPASTVQILGAEKALFRALKTRGNTPKYGLLYNASFIGRAGAKNKGRISRYLANKCSIASRIDCFADQEVGSSVYGDKLRQQVEDRLRFYETGDVPKKNLDVMQEAHQELQQMQLENDQSNSSKKNKKKKVLEVAEEAQPELELSAKKKKKKRKSESNDDGHIIANGNENGDVDTEPPSKKKKKKKKSQSEEN